MESTVSLQKSLKELQRNVKIEMAELIKNTPKQSAIKSKKQTKISSRTPKKEDRHEEEEQMRLQKKQKEEKEEKERIRELAKQKEERELEEKEMVERIR